MTAPTAPRPTAGPLRRAGRPQPASRWARGFSLLELSIVVALVSALFLVLTGWVFSLSKTANSAMDAGGARRDAAYANDLLTGDTQAARGCDPAGLDVPLRDLRTDAVQLHVTHTDSAGVAQPGAPVDLVLWRLAGTDLQRAVLLGDGDCTFDPDEALWTTVASVSAADGSPAFAGVGNRYAAPDDEPYYGECTGLAAERCLDTGLAVDLVFLSGGSDSTGIPVRTVYPLTTSGSAL